MIYYLLFFVFAGVASLLSSGRYTNYSLLGFFLVLVLFVGLRHEVGTDWPNYVRIHKVWEHRSFFQALTHTEPMSYFVIWLSQSTGFSVYGTNIVCALILLSGIMAFAKTTLNPWLAIVAALPFLVFVTGMGAVRQSMAIGVSMFALSHWARLSVNSRVFYIIFACMFHLSALIMLAFLPIATNLKLYARIILVALGVILSIASGFLFVDQFSSYHDSYISGNNVVVATGALFHLLPILAPSVLCMFFRKRLAAFMPNSELVFYGSLLSLTLIITLSISTVAASRVSNYLYFVPMAVTASLPKIFTARSRAIVVLTLVAINASLLIGWMTLSNNAKYHQHYRNIIIVNAYV